MPLFIELSDEPVSDAVRTADHQDIQSSHALSSSVLCYAVDTLCMRSFGIIIKSGSVIMSAPLPFG